MNIALYPGSFDPPTHGHLSVIRRASALFDRLFVLVAVNPDKKPMLETEMRVRILRSVLSGSNVSICACKGLVADFAARVGARYLIRGVRTQSDMNDEIRMASHNAVIRNGLQTLFFPTESKYGTISSTALRMAYKAGARLNMFTIKKVQHLMQHPGQPSYLQAHWYRTGMDLKAKEAVWDQVYAMLLKRYGEGHRVYHTLGHVEEGLRHLEAFDLPETVQSMCSIAFWFHDAIYRPWRSNNEARSAALARRWLVRAGLAPDLIHKVSDLIQMTRDHRTPNDDPWAQLFLDVDLAILSAPEPQFTTYEAQIAEEYRMLPFFLYRRGRKKALEGFLARETIYRSPWFAHREQAARENIHKSLLSL